MMIELNDDEIDTPPNKYEIHPEAFFLGSFRWEGMITIRFEDDSHSADNGEGAARRECFLRLLMNNLRQKWNLRKKQIYWVSSVEFGDSGTGHAHLIFNFYPLESSGKPVPDLANFRGLADESINYLCDELKLNRSSIGMHWAPKYDDQGLVDYVCKKEEMRPFKEFVWSSNPGIWAHPRKGGGGRWAVI